MNLKLNLINFPGIIRVKVNSGMHVNALVYSLLYTSQNFDKSNQDRWCVQRFLALITFSDREFHIFVTRIETNSYLQHKTDKLPARFCLRE